MIIFRNKKEKIDKFNEICSETALFGRAPNIPEIFSADHDNIH